MNDLYSTQEKRFDTMLGNSNILSNRPGSWDFWHTVSKCWRAERGYGLRVVDKTDGSYSPLNNTTMTHWFLETYGILMTESKTDPGMLDRYVTIVDEEKFSMFVLKWA
jgi:hypothetical protein